MHDEKRLISQKGGILPWQKIQLNQTNRSRRRPANKRALRLRLAGMFGGALLLAGCADFGRYVSAIDVQSGVSSDPYNSNSTRVTLGGKIYFRDPTARRLPNYSKDK